MNARPLQPALRSGTIPARSAYSLLELVAALSTSALLVISLSLTIFMASQMTETALPTALTASGADVLYQIADELQDAIYVLTMDDHQLEFAVADRNGDGTPDVVRYQWSGTPGDPLLRSWNHGSPVEVVRAVDSFQLTYDTTTTTEQLPATTTESDPDILASWEGGSNNGDGSVTTSNWFGQYFTANLPPDALSWRVTKVELRLRGAGLISSFQVQLRRTAGDRKPISAVLAQDGLNLTLLSGSYGWRTYSPSGATGLSPNEGLALVVRSSLGSINAQYQTSGVDAPPHAMVATTDGGATWSVHPTQSLRYRVHGRYTTPDSQLDVARSYLTGIGMTMRPTGSGSLPLRTAAPALNSPELLADFWELDFTTNPLVVDANHDGQGDWLDTSFDPNHLVSGVWRVPQSYTGKLETRHEVPANGPITVHLRCRATSVGGDGAVLEMNLDTGSDTARLRLCVSRTSYGTQVARLYRNITFLNEVQLVAEHELPLDFVEVRLVIVPSSQLVSVWVNEVQRGSFTYAGAGISGGNVFRLYPSGADAEFDYLSIRAG